MLHQVGCHLCVESVEAEEEVVLGAAFHFYILCPVALVGLEGEEGFLVIHHKFHIIASGIGEEIESLGQGVLAAEDKAPLPVAVGGVHHLVALGEIVA